MNILGYLKLDLEAWLLVVIDAHLTVVLIVFFMLKERNPLSVGVETSVQNNVLWNGDATDVLSHTW